MLHSQFRRFVTELSQVVFGRPEIVELAVIALLAKGNILFEDRPGVGKTTLSKSLAKGLGLKFSRVQGTADLTPFDVLGGVYFDEKSRDFKLRRGPIFSDVLLVDELNRASARAQSALLEAMEERSVTLDGNTEKLSESFFLIATQNPSGSAGTALLPESQLDRFMMRLSLGLPSRENERKLIQSAIQNADKNLSTLLQPTDLIEARAQIKSVFISEAIQEYLLALSQKSRELGAGYSPRASLDLLRATQACAFLNGRQSVLPDDVKFVFLPVMNHRIEQADEVVSKVTVL